MVEVRVALVDRREGARTPRLRASARPGANGEWRAGWSRRRDRCAFSSCESVGSPLPPGACGRAVPLGHGSCPAVATVDERESLESAPTSSSWAMPHNGIVDAPGPRSAASSTASVKRRDARPRGARRSRPKASSSLVTTAGPFGTARPDRRLRLGGTELLPRRRLRGSPARGVTPEPARTAEAEEAAPAYLRRPHPDRSQRAARVAARSAERGSDASVARSGHGRDPRRALRRAAAASHHQI